MDLEQRVAELERRLAALEAGRSADAPAAPEAPAGEPDEDFWALQELKRRLPGLDGGATEASGEAGGAVVFTGAVRLPTGECYEWQWGKLTSALLAVNWADASDAFAALGHPVRLRLLSEVLGGCRTVAELAELDGLGTTGQIYHHLRQLTAAGWLHTAARGQYEVPPPRVVPLLVALTAARP
ncbi:helix-turn-helix domain-containing protein [Streptomyces sp. NPDC047315]|uniref:ArsR/SmtB family transcription factor n=1 Tax=Streptomyces sp. NPDC047315 TaxID=3155142 RepID=UPI0033E9FA08